MFRLRSEITYEQANALGLMLEMQPDTLDRNLQVLEELGWAELHKSPNGRALRKIEEHIPPLPIVIEKLGKLALEQEAIPSLQPLLDLEKASVAALHLCAEKPATVEAVVSQTGIQSDAEADLLKRLGKAGRYLDELELADKKRVMWSPVYYFNRFEDVVKFLKRQTVSGLEVVSEVLDQCARQVGMPLEVLPREQHSAASSGARSGWLVPVSLSIPFHGILHEHTFLFPPLREFQDAVPSGDVFEKAKVLISSFRLGEHFAPTTKIRNPVDVVRKLRTAGRLGIPHSDALDQYRIPASRGILTMEEATRTTAGGSEYTGYIPVLIRSPENEEVLQTAERLLKPLTAVISDSLQDDVRLADTVLKQTNLCLESLEFRGSPMAQNLPVDEKLERRLEKLALVVHGGAYG